ncbi:MAG: hypothetical protein DRP47_09855 [Candidatus Zixiibacteriota bacterium]|nr:MAG: hypothetical protein DRP47_09855 [candidate division Zixibacteria bacterium]
MLELLNGLIVLVALVSSYLITRYSLAVNIDPDDLSSLHSNISGMRYNFLCRLAKDPQTFIQIATIYKSFALMIISIISYHILKKLCISEKIPGLLISIVGLAVMWLIYLMVIEYLPRRSSRKAINRRMTKYLWFIFFVYYLFYPLVKFYQSILHKLTDDTKVTEEEKEEIVGRAIETLAEQAGISETIVEDDEKEMIGQIFLLDQTVVREIMVPRIQITAIDKTMTFSDIRRMVLKDGHSRYPVYDESIDKIIGLVYVKDLFNNLPEPGEKFVITDFLREPYFVPEAKVIGDLLREFKEKQLHIAMVVDEYGGVAGLVTLEDIIEEIFGEIQDEHDQEQEDFSVLPDGRYLVDAGLLVDDLQDRLETDYEQGDYDTVGGLIYDLVGSVPREGQVVKWYGLEFVVEKLDGQRIVSVIVSR